MSKKTVFDLDPEQLSRLLSIGTESENGADAIPADSAGGSDVGPGTKIDHFQVDSELGRGGAGVVYLAHDTRLGRKVAIKMLPPEVVNNPQILHRWKREAQLLASLDHPNIAAIHEELEETEGKSYLVLEYVEGETLRERIARDRLSVEQAVSIALQIVEAISAAHGQGIVHRDLKPANIKITPEGRVKVLDFGVAKILADRRNADSLDTIVTQPGQVIGTPGYMSPEQSLGKETDHRTDIWSFGCVLYEMLTAQRPFPGRDTSEVLEAMLRKEPDWKSLPRQVEPPLREIIGKCLAKDAGERYQSSTELYKDLSEYYTTLTTPAQKLSSIFALFRKPRFAIPAVFVFVILCIMSVWFINKSSKIRHARTILLPKAINLAEDGKYLAAFFTAQEVEDYIPNDTMLIKLWPEISKDYSIVTTPPGADVFFREYSEMDGEWSYLGKSPMENIRFPKGLYRFKIEKEGFVPRECVAGQREHAEANLLMVELWQVDSSPDNMVLISSGTDQPKPLEDDSEQADVPGYWIDKYEVTNEQFKRFVDQGGYQEQRYWKHEFVKDGRKLSWQEAMKEFRDQSGRAGPSTWSGGTFPEGKEKHPVSGVSWYEAAAYAEFAGKSLPTRGHWRRASCRDQLGAIVPWSNMEAKESAPVGNHPGIGLTGIYDMAGNVREWCYNAEESEHSRRYIMGGSWAEPTYMFDWRWVSLSAWDRSPVNGFRCAVFGIGETEAHASWFDPIKKSSKEDFSDLSQLNIVSEEVFKVWLQELYSYEKKSLNAKTISIDDSSPYYRKEEVEFDAAYGGERVTAFLLLPKSAQPPYQVVVYFPGKGAFDRSDKEKMSDVIYLDFIIKSGRALMYPLYKGSHGQRVRDRSGSVNSRDWNIELTKDLGRSVDYLESRDDINTKSAAYFGFSLGASKGPILLAVERRLKTGILVSGGLGTGGTSLPSGKPANFAPRITMPILMVNGKEDALFGYETSQLPLYKLLGTPEEHKKHITYPGGHGLIGSSRVQMQKDILAWLDKYLGPVD